MLQDYDLVFSIEKAGITEKPQQLEIHKVLVKALGNRAENVYIQPPESHTSSSPKFATLENQESSKKLILGITFDSLHIGRQMEYGPAADEPKEAEKFRRFWGERAELRRFKNGNILECVEWTKRMPADICEEIVRYVLRRHADISQEHLTFYGRGFSSALQMTNVDRFAFDSAKTAFQTFETDLRGLEGMPLQIRHVSPTSAGLRYCSVDVPGIGFSRETPPQPLEVFLTFEASAKWPENLIAIQQAKIEFLLDIGRRLGEAVKGLGSHLGRDNVDGWVRNLAYLDIIYSSGAVFRLRILCDVEETLLDRQTKNKTLDAVTRSEADEALNLYRWYSTQLPIHSQTMSRHCTRLPPLSPTIRLVKQWFSQHMLSAHFPEELIELFVLHVFLQPDPWKKSPSSVTTGFLRTLQFLSRWDWRDEPLVIDSSDEDADPEAVISTANRSSVYQTLHAWRKRDPNMNRVVMIVATPHDLDGLAFTRNLPSRVTAMRMTRLATAACDIIKQDGLLLDGSKLFRPSLRDYDVVIHLSNKVVRGALRAASNSNSSSRFSISGTQPRPTSQFKNLDDRTGKISLPVGRHPTDVLLDELRRAYSDSMLFFHGDANISSGGEGSSSSIIGAIWYPRKQAQKFRVGLPYNFRSVGGGKATADGDDDENEAQQVTINKQAILLEIARIGGDLIKRIEQGS